MPARRRNGVEVADRVVEHLPRAAASIVDRLRREDVFMLSAGLAFYALVSLAPFAILLMWLVSLVSGEDEVRQAGDRLAGFLPPDLGVSEAVERVADLGHGLGLGAVVALLWPATAYGTGLSRAFERLCPGDDRPAKGLRRRALALGLVGVMPALVLTGLVFSYLGTVLVARGLLATVLGWALALVFGFAGSAATTAALYGLFSPRRVDRNGLVRGAATAGAAISLLSAGYAVFLHVGADFENRYAASGLAALVLLAVWLFLANALILVGYQVAMEDKDAPMAPPL